MSLQQLMTKTLISFTINLLKSLTWRLFFQLLSRLFLVAFMVLVRMGGDDPGKEYGDEEASNE
jgi:hypothetical protein